MKKKIVLLLTILLLLVSVIPVLAQDSSIYISPDPELVFLGNGISVWICK